MIRECLARRGREDLVDAAELLVSEVVTNALVHAGTDIEVALSFVDGGLRVEVSDGSPHAPSPRGYGPSAGTGRGLMLLQELVDDWGVVPGEAGKTVWFALDCRQEALAAPGPGAQADPASPAAAPHLPGADTVRVELRDVPLLLHEAWRQHAESLLREYLLASLDVDGPDGPEQAIETHAQASDAIALLGEHVPPSGVGEDPGQVMVTAVDPLVTGASVHVDVPRASLAHFATLDRALRAALELADAGTLLTPPTQPELQALRVWLCGEVLGQSDGAEPAAWSSLDEPPTGHPHLLRWDGAHVSGSPRAALAVDDTDRIVAASRGALDLVGVAEEDDLLGERLISIIPERYRQAHLAGFTMHFLSGRAPLIGATVVVPALRADGSEVAVALTIRAERTEDGRTVFVADLDPDAA